MNKTRSAAITVAAALGIGLGSYGIAAAQSTPDSTPDPAEGTEADGATEAEEVNEAGDEPIDPARAAEAKITETEAQAAAVAAVGGGTASDAVLEDEDGMLIFEVDVTDGAGVSTEVAVDATTGEAVVESEDEDAEHEDEDGETESDDVDQDDVEHENEHEGENDPDEGHED